MKALFYACVRRIFYYYHYLYFRKIEVVGLSDLPKEGSLLFSPNHQGAFLDPIIVGSIVKKPVTYLTRGDVFGGRLQWFLDALRMLPVYRIRNGYSSLKNNKTTFEQCYELLAKGEHLMMFSEGLHHAEYYLHSLSKGSSRLMYEAQERYPNQKMYIVPVGVNYGHFRRPFGDLHLVFGEAIAVEKYFDSTKSPAQNINSLREALAEGMKTTLWIPEQTDAYEQQVEALHPKNTKLSFVDLKKALKEHPDRLKKKPTLSFFAQALLFLAEGAYFIPFWGLKRILSLFEDKVFHNAFKYMYGLLILPFWWGSCAYLSAFFFGWKVVLYIVLILIALLYSRQYLLLFKK